MSSLQVRILGSALGLLALAPFAEIEASESCLILTSDVILHYHISKWAAMLVNPQTVVCALAVKIPDCCLVQEALCCVQHCPFPSCFTFAL